MLNQPLMEKLVAMRWQGMVEGLKTQEQDRAIHELSFLERLSLLVDQQWNWRENQALERRLKAAKLRGPACVEDIDYRAARGLDKSVVRALAQRLCLGPQSREHLRARTDRRGQELCRLRPGAESLPRRLLGSLLRAAALFRDLAIARADGSLRQLLAKTQPHRCIGDRRLGHGAVERTGAPRLLGNLRGSLPNSLHDPRRRNCPSHAGTSRSAIRPSPTASSTAWSTTPTASRCAETRCGKSVTHPGSTPG